MLKIFTFTFVLLCNFSLSGEIPFAQADVYFEQNATDGDVEVVFEIKGSEEGLTNLKIVSPDDRTVVDFTSTSSTLGIRQFRFESPEPKDIKSLKSAYPEGEYTFTGKTASGKNLNGKASLSHTLPPTSSFLNKNVEISWKPVKNVTAYIIKIDQDDLGINLNAKLPSTTTSFKIPNNFITPLTEYQLSVGTVSEEGNISFIETTFTPTVTHTTRHSR